MQKNISYVSCELSQDINDHLFQISSVITHSLQSGKSPVFRKSSFVSTDEQTYQWNCLIKNNLILMEDKEYDQIEKEYVQLCNDFNSIDVATKKKMQDIVYSNEDYMYKAYNMYNKVKRIFENECDDDYVCMHVEKKEVLIKYYSNAYQKVCENGSKHLVILTDDIDWCKYNLAFCNNDNVYFVGKQNIGVEFILISFFQHNITSSSLYSLWASFISNYQNKIIIAPEESNKLKRLLHDWQFL
jgi:hypothetical protein